MITEPVCSFWYDAAPAWFAALGTFTLAFVAVFQEWLKRLFVRPKLQLNAIMSGPDCHKTKFAMGAEVYFFRLRVENTGNTAARDVQVYLARVERKRLDQRYETVERFIPMNLVWAILNRPDLPILLPSMPPRYCDLAHISDPRQRLSVNEDLPGVPRQESILGLNLEVTPNNKGHLLEAGAYRFHLKLAASNHPLRDYTLEVDFMGKWFDDVEEMFRDGFGMRLVKP